MGPNRGFSLVEMAIVLVVMGALLGGLVLPLRQTVEQTRRSDAKAQLAEIRHALLGFAASRGRLPCPATPPSAGLEDPIGGGNCIRQHGFLPARTLALHGRVNGDGLLLDPWNGPVHYSVTQTDNGAVPGADFTSAGQMAAEGLGTLLPDLVVCSRASGSASACTGSGNRTLADEAVAVVHTAGRNRATFSSASETENSGEAVVGGGATGQDYRLGNDRVFVARAYDEATFDDVVDWLSPNVLYDRMIAAGALP